MSVPPKFVKVYPISSNSNYDFQKIGDIVQALDYLRIEAGSTGDPDLEMLINSTFNICFTSYYTAMRMRALDEMEA